MATFISRFTGDPTLTSQMLNALISTLAKRGITSINGAVYVDANTFDSDYYPKGSSIDDINLLYSSPISSVIIDRNAFHITATITPHLSPAISIHNTHHLNVTIRNNLYLSSASDCSYTIESNAQNSYTFEGCIHKPRYKQTLTFSLAIHNPIQLAQNKIATYMKTDAFIYSTRSVLVARLSMRSRLQNTSLSLSVMLIHMLKHSDNLYANAITKTLGHLHSGHPASWDDGVNAIKTILSTQAHLNKKNLDFMDGAGISRYNLTTPQSIAHLLQFIQKHPLSQSTLSCFTYCRP